MRVTAAERDYFFPVAIIEHAEKLGLTHEKLNTMVRLSTRITHPFGNRRYENFLFTVEGDRVTSFGRVVDNDAGHEVNGVIELPEGTRCATCMDTKRVQTFDACDRCDGSAAGCRYCDYGLVPSSIPCPKCS